MPRLRLLSLLPVDCGVGALAMGSRRRPGPDAGRCCCAPHPSGAGERMVCSWPAEFEGCSADTALPPGGPPRSPPAAAAAACTGAGAGLDTAAAEAAAAAGAAVVTGVGTAAGCALDAGAAAGPAGTSRAKAVCTAKRAPEPPWAAAAAGAGARCCLPSGDAWRPDCRRAVSSSECPDVTDSSAPPHGLAPPVRERSPPSLSAKVPVRPPSSAPRCPRCTPPPAKLPARLSSVPPRLDSGRSVLLRAVSGAPPLPDVSN